MSNKCCDKQTPINIGIMSEKWVCKVCDVDLEPTDTTGVFKCKKDSKGELSDLAKAISAGYVSVSDSSDFIPEGFTVNIGGRKQASEYELVIPHGNCRYDKN